MLLAEDDDDVRETMWYWLADEDGWDVLEATTGGETLDLLDGSVDLLVLDRRMPGPSGSEIVDRIAETEFSGPVLVATAYDPDDELGEDAVDRYLTKPITRDTFLTHLADLEPRT